MEIREILKKELIDKSNHHLTVGDLKKFLNKHNLPDNAVVLIQRVEDIYYEKHQWGVYLKEGEYTIKDTEGKIEKDSLTQYTPAWCCVNYKDENELLFIDLHY